LNSHLSPIVAQTLRVRNGNSVFTCIPRPPYQPTKFGPIEYKICDCIATASKKITATSTTQDLEIAIRNAAAEIGSFNDTFAHFGYP